jgi:hypothetical protein
MDENFEPCPPRADAMIHSMRAFGYDLGMAVADLIDNSLFAGASEVKVSYSWNKGNPWVMIIDNGKGMSDKRLFEAMRLGSKSPLEDRDPKDLGRFGLGLKTASFSQCKLFSVLTKTANGITSSRFWDLDRVQKSQSWDLGKKPGADAIALLAKLTDQKCGTAILWQKLDRVVDHESNGAHNPEDSFNKKFVSVKTYLDTVFHRYLESKHKKISIKVGIAKCEPWDPYLTKNKFTYIMSSEKYEDSRVEIMPYVLPHISKRSEDESLAGGGIKGWNAQQGFYIYRNNRMIVSGGYLSFDLKAEEHFKLARISIAITNDMDHEWSIDVRKAVATPPDRLRGDLLRIARVCRQKASEVYRARAGRSGSRSPREGANDVWLKKISGDKIVYKLNRNNKVLTKIFEEINCKKTWITKLFHVIETTVPHRLIIMDGLEHEDCHVDLPFEINPPPSELISLCFEFYNDYCASGKSHQEAVDIVCSMDAFSTHPKYRACLDDSLHKGKK